MSRIWVVGSASDDLLVLLPSLPSPGETVTGGKLRSGLGGKGANQAVAAARLGGSVAFIGAVGDDQSGSLVRAALEAAGIDTTHLLTITGATSRALGMVAVSSGENMWGIDQGANGAVSRADVSTGLRDAARGDIIVSVNEMPEEAVVAAAEIASERACRFVLNAAPGRRLAPNTAALCEVVIANEIEILQLGYTGPEELIEHRVGCVIITLGDKGAVAYEPGGHVERAAALSVDVVDTTGAGDAFVGAYVVALAEGHDHRGALRWGTAAGSLACRSVGARAGLPDRNELEAALR